MKKYLLFGMCVWLYTATLSAQNNIVEFMNGLDRYKQECILMQNKIEEVKKKMSEMQEAELEGQELQSIMKKIEREIGTTISPTGKMKKMGDWLNSILDYKLDSQPVANPQYRGTYRNNVIITPTNGRGDGSPEAHVSGIQMAQPPVDRSAYIRDLLSKRTLRQIYENRAEIEVDLKDCLDTNLKDTYITLIKLFGFQHVQYDLRMMGPVFDKANYFKKEQMVKKEHYDELVIEITLLTRYRKATTNLRDLLASMMQPDEYLKSMINGDSRGLGDKVTTKGTILYPTPDVKECWEYIVNHPNNSRWADQIQSINEFEYTKRMLNEFVSMPDKQKFINELTNALEKK